MRATGTTEHTQTIQVVNGGVYYQGDRRNTGVTVQTKNHGVIGALDGNPIDRFQAAVISTRATGLCYSINVANSWSPEVCGGGIIGTQGSAIEAIRMRLTGAPAGCSVRYQTHVSGLVWTPYSADNAPSGTIGVNRSIDALLVELTEACVP